MLLQSQLSSSDSEGTIILDLPPATVDQDTGVPALERTDSVIVS